MPNDDNDQTPSRPPGASPAQPPKAEKRKKFFPFSRKWLALQACRRAKAMLPQFALTIAGNVDIPFVDEEAEPRHILSVLTHGFDGVIALLEGRTLNQAIEIAVSKRALVIQSLEFLAENVDDVVNSDSIIIPGLPPPSRLPERWRKKIIDALVDAIRNDAIPWAKTAPILA